MSEGKRLTKLEAAVAVATLLGFLSSGVLWTLNHFFPAHNRQFPSKEGEANNLPQPLPEPQRQLPSPVRSQPQAHSVNKIGIWAGAVTCERGQYFSVLLTIDDQTGQNGSGRMQWSGSRSGTDNIILSPNPDAQGTASHIIIPSRRGVYSYLINYTSENVVQGYSTGREQCKMRLERK